ncbi:MAG: recombination-associated protein RdgC [Betaproteobacteria bacterium]|jgi:recombination associated protein RdgC
MLKSFTCFRIQEGWQAPDFHALSDALGRSIFRPCGPTERRTSGWVPPRGVAHGPLLESVSGQWLMTLMSETRQLPASAVRAELDLRLDAVEAQIGRRPRGKAKREMKEQVEHELMPRAFTGKSAVMVWIDPRSRMLVLGTPSAKGADLVVAELLTVFEDRLPLAPLHTAQSPAGAMATWLASRQAPAGFSIDLECELRQGDDTRATVKYTRHTLDTDEVALHLHHGKLPAYLAMTWADRVSFVLTDDMKIKRVKFLDVQTAAAPGTARDGEEDHFDANAALATGELSQLMGDLLDALGGEQAPGVPADGALLSAPAERR